MVVTRRILLTLIATALTGCASFNGQMVDANGTPKNCSTTGGGLGLGAVIGATMALASNQACESDLASKGFVLKKDLGKSGIDLDQQIEDKAVVADAKPPAAACIKPGDVLVQIDDIIQPDKTAAKKALFGKAGKPLKIAFVRGETSGSCQLSLTN